MDAPPVDLKWHRKIAHAVFLASTRDGRLNCIKFYRENPGPHEHEPDVPGHVAWCESHLDDPVQPISRELATDELRNTFVLGGLPVEGVGEDEIKRIQQESELIAIKLRERIKNLKGTLN